MSKRPLDVGDTSDPEADESPRKALRPIEPNIRRSAAQRTPFQQVAAVHGDPYDKSNVTVLRNSKTTAEIYADPNKAALQRVLDHIDSVKFTRVRAVTIDKKSAAANLMASAAATSSTSTSHAAGPSTSIATPADTPAPPVVGMLDHVLQLPAPHGNRNFQPFVENKTSNRKREDSNGVERKIVVDVYWLWAGRVGKAHERFFGFIDKTGTVTRSVALEVCALLTDFLNKFPGGIDLITDTKGGSRFKAEWLVYEAYSRKAPGASKLLPAPSLKWPDNASTARMRVGIVRIDPITLKQERWESWLTNGQMHIEDVLTPDNALWYKDNTVRTSDNVNDFTQSNLPVDLGQKEGQRSGLLKVEQLLRAVQARLWAIRATADQMSSLYEYHLNSYAKTKASNRFKKNMVYGNQGIIFMNARLPCTYIIGPSRYVVADIDLARGPPIPEIRIRSLDRNRTVPVQDAILQTWSETASINKAWMAGAIAADAVNTSIADGIPSDATCTCQSGDQAKHTCCICCSPFWCYDMVTGRFGFKVCQTCHTKDQSRVKTMAPLQLCLQKARSVLRNECRISQIVMEPAEFDQLLLGLQNDVRQAFANGNFQELGFPDGLCGNMTRTMTVESSMQFFGRNPFTPSLDAIFPYAITSGGRILKHTSGNIAITTLALNFAKHVHLPGFLKKLGEFVSKAVNLFEDSSEQARLSAKVELIAEAAAYRTQRVHAKYTQVRREEESVKSRRNVVLLPDLAKKVTLDRQRWIRKVSPAGGPWDTAHFRWEWHFAGAQGFTQFAFSSDITARAREFVNSAEKEFGVVLPRSSDGCPWISIKETMPERWGWGMCGLMISEAHDRVRDKCNKRDPTVDGPEEIFDVICIIAIINIWKPSQKGKAAVSRNCWDDDQKRELQNMFAEFLGLPLVADSWNALSFAITHRFHGRPMSSGLPLQPRSISQWSPDECNILLESSTSNFLKHNFESDTYEDVRQMVQGFANMSTELSDPSSNISQAQNPPLAGPGGLSDLEVERLLDTESKIATMNDVAEALSFERDSMIDTGFDVEEADEPLSVAGPNPEPDISTTAGTSAIAGTSAAGTSAQTAIPLMSSDDPISPMQAGASKGPAVELGDSDDEFDEDWETIMRDAEEMGVKL